MHAEIQAVPNLHSLARPLSVHLKIVARLSALGPVACHCTETVSPVIVIPSLMRCTQQSVMVSELESSI